MEPNTANSSGGLPDIPSSVGELPDIPVGGGAGLPDVPTSREELPDIPIGGVQTPAMAAARGLPPTSSAHIQRSEQYSPEEGFIETALSAFDYLGNISRSTILGATRDGLDGAVKYAKQAWDKQRRTSPAKIRELYSDALGLEKSRFSDKDDAWYHPASVGDFAIDMLVDITTDPLTLISGGLGSVAKGAGRKALPKLSKSLNLARNDPTIVSTLSKVDMDAAKAAALGLNVSRASLGALYGLGTAPQDSTIGEKLYRAGAGAGMVMAGIKAGPSIGAAMKTGARNAANIYADARSSDIFGKVGKYSKLFDFSTAEELAVKGYDRAKYISEWIRQGKMDVMAGRLDPKTGKRIPLTNADKVETAQTMQAAKTEFLRRRKEIEPQTKQFEQQKEAYKNVVNFTKEHMEAPDLSDAGIMRAMKIMEKEPVIQRNFLDAADYMNVTKKLNKEITQEMEAPGGFVQALLKDKEDKIVHAVTDWAEHNNNVMGRLNKEFGTDAVGIKYHIDKAFQPADFAKADKLAKDFKLHRATSLKQMPPEELANAMQRSALTNPKILKRLQKENPLVDFSKKADADNFFLAKAYDETYGAYTERFAKNFLDSQTRHAMSAMSEYTAAIPTNSLMRKAETGLKAFDKTLNLAKANMLYFSMTWLKTNYFDNMAKAFVENGYGGMIDSATMGFMRKGMREDVSGILKNKSKQYNRADMDEMLEEGVLDNVMFRSMMDEETKKFLTNPTDLKKQLEEKGFLEQIGKTVGGVRGEKGGEVLGKALDAWTEGLSRTVGFAGSYLESTARATTYIRAKQALKKSVPGMNEKALREAAADITKKTFFDYQDISHLEKATLKRIFPFYSFYSKNLPYWAKTIVDPEKVGRIAQIDKARRKIGEEPTERDRLGMANYLLEGAPRMMGKTKRGEDKIAISPSFSLIDAMKMMGPAKAILDLFSDDRDVSEPFAEAWSQIVEKANPFFKLPYELISGNDLFTGGKLYPSSSLKARKYIFSRGFKWYAAKEALKAAGLGEDGLIDVAKNVGVKLDDKGNPVSTRDWNIVVDKVASTFFPTGALDQIAGSIGKVLFDKETIGEAVANRLLPIQTVKQSPAFARLTRSRRRKEERLEKKRKRAYEKEND